MTSENLARSLVLNLIGDEDWTTPNGTKAYTYFQRLGKEEAFKEWRQIHQLPEGFRQRDLLERMEEDR